MHDTTSGGSPPAVCLPHDPRTRRPRYALPVGATDCHCHVFQDPQRYPLQPDRSYTPAPATLQDYLAMCDLVGLQRTVQVSASVYGTDNSLTLAVIAALGQHRARGVAGIALDTPDAELARLDAGGIRGARVSTSVRGYPGTDAIGLLAPRLQPLGWHLQVHVAGIEELVALEDTLLRTPVPLVFDHLGCARGGEGIGQPGFQALLRILRQRDDAWCKLSSWYRRSDMGPPDYPDMGPLVHALVAARPDRMLFGTNWPHPGMFAPEAVPNDGRLVEQFCQWVPSPETRKRILVDNPAQLYGFPPA